VLADLRVLRGRSFRNLFASQTISLLGSAIAPVALAFAIPDERAGRPTTSASSWPPAATPTAATY
jgi:hypothetical protein